MQSNDKNNNQSSLSPTKRPAFRSKTKLNANANTPQQSKLKTITSYKMYLKQFPLGMAQDVLKIIESFEPVHNQFTQNLDSLRLYKPQLSFQFQNNWAEFMEVLRIIIMKLNKRTDKFSEQKQQQIAHLLQLNSQSQRQIQKLKQKFDHVDHIRQIQKAELQVANNQVQTVNRQMNDIYDILKTDMNRILQYLTSVQKSKQRQIRDQSQKIYASLQNFNLILNSMENEHKGTAGTLSTMKQMIKAMARGTKTTTGTQVDQSQLLSKAQNIFGSQEKAVEGLSYQTLDAASVNVADKGKYDHVIDKLKLKQKDQTHQTYHPKKNTQKPWTLTPTLLTFLQNMSKQNETGRVVPWQYMKNLIDQIYQDRIKFQNQMVSGMVGNSMLFDQFVVFYFLKKYKVRRLAEVKLLQFIISLKYYSKFWLKAETVCILMDVMRFIPMFDQTDMYNYKVDYYTQNYFFQVYKIISSFDLIHQEDGSVFVPTKKVKKLMKAILFFTEQTNRSRLFVKIQKQMKIIDKVQCVDFDFAVMLFLQQYFSVRRKNSAQIARLFSKTTQKVEGFFSIDDILGIFNQFSKMYNAAEQFSQKYPVQSQLHIAKLYLYSITSGKNNYEITSTNFLQACQRYGFDSPFPFLHNCQKKIKSAQKGFQEQKQQQKQQKQGVQNPDKKKKKQAEPAQNIQTKQKQQQPNLQIKYINLNQQRIDVASKLFSQHFSLLKQLKDYVTIFSTTLATQKDPEVLWKSFNQIKAILEKGCAFMKYPLVAKQ